MLRFGDQMKMTPVPVSIKFKSIQQKRQFAGALASTNLVGNGYEFNLPPEREAQQANEIYDLLVTFFEYGGAEAIAAVATTLTTVLAIIFKIKNKEKSDSESKPEEILIIINNDDVKIDASMNESAIEAKLIKALEKDA
jgi:hypothetical protein